MREPTITLRELRQELKRLRAWTRRAADLHPRFTFRQGQADAFDLVCERIIKPREKQAKRTKPA